MDLQLQGKTALVTGSHRGTGLTIAKTLASEGMQVLVHGLQAGQSEAAVQDIGVGVAITADITCEAGAAELQTACEPFHIDVLVNNYGVAEPSRWAEGSTEPWLEAYEKNVLSAQRAIGICLPNMQRAGWGRIINLGTVGSTQPNARNPGYYSAKGALATMTVSLARELAGSGVRVNLVSPGLIHTPEVEQAYMQQGQRKGWGDTWAEVEAQVAKDIPIGRIVRRKEVADLVAFLASPLADAIHSQNVRIDGGALAITS